MRKYAEWIGIAAVGLAVGILSIWLVPCRCETRHLAKSDTVIEGESREAPSAGDPDRVFIEDPDKPGSFILKWRWEVPSEKGTGYGR